MKRRGILLLAGLAVALVDLLPVALILKQAFSPEAESLAWPPTWFPHHATMVNFVAVGEGSELSSGLRLSLSVGLSSVVLTLGLALPAAWVAARRPRVHRRLNLAIVVARLFPPIAVAVPLAAVFIQLGLYNHPAGVGLALAHTLLAVPLAFLILRPAFGAIPVELEEAALLDGATAFGAFWRISFPLTRPSLAAAAILVFLVSWDEITYALLLQVTNRSLPPLLYYFAAFGHPGLASALAVIMLVPAIAVVLVLDPALRSGILSGSGR